MVAGWLDVADAWLLADWSTPGALSLLLAGLSELKRTMEGALRLVGCRVVTPACRHPIATPHCAQESEGCRTAPTGYTYRDLPRADTVLLYSWIHS